MIVFVTKRRKNILFENSFNHFTWRFESRRGYWLSRCGSPSGQSPPTDPKIITMLFGSMVPWQIALKQLIQKAREPGSQRASHSGQRASHSGQRASHSGQRASQRPESLSQRPESISQRPESISQRLESISKRTEDLWPR